jgi:hypothetical protein
MIEPPPTLDPAETETTVRRHSHQKSNGVHYTPSELAAFVARRALAQLPTRSEFVVLDPACGDGELLLATAVAAEAIGLPAPRLVGVDNDDEAIAAARRRLADAAASAVLLHAGDFLAMGLNDAAGLPPAYDLIISNPPYVRTQVLGAARAQALGRQFGLAGRVDLYHAFVAAMTARLASGGVLGLLCSNRFLTTKGGQSLRSLLLGNYNIAELWDLGDTKLFDAAVLPAVVVARRGGASPGNGSFVRVYEEEGDSEEAVEVESLSSALEGSAEGIVSVADRTFAVERGRLVNASPDQPWRLVSRTTSRWLATVKRRTAGRLGELGRIRVGIKTTADSVFIRTSWDDLPEAMRPEDELVHPLLTHRVASRWRPGGAPGSARSVLYPHVVAEGRRRAADLSLFPRAAAYLETNRERLESREYVRKAGRAWYEIWVPQQPDAWAAPKLVWPDISERPKFFLDTTGAIVNGDCYWLSCRGLSEDEIALALAVANSTFALRYYDRCCGNRLYAGRRRFITQYLEELPMPQTGPDALREVAAMVAQLRQPTSNEGDEGRAAVETALDEVIFELFGLEEPGR